MTTTLGKIGLTGHSPIGQFISLLFSPSYILCGVLYVDSRRPMQGKANKEYGFGRPFPFSQRKERKAK
jgi:hypothetical protein